MSNNKYSLNIVLHDRLHIRLDTTNYEYLNKVKEHFTEYVDGYMFIPLYKSGRWNGKKSIFNTNVRRLPYGLITDLLKFTKKEFPELEIIVDSDITSLFRGIEPDTTWNLKHYPYPYQEECILAALKYSKGIFSVVTAGGKSLIIAYIIKELLKKDIKNCIIIVPTAGLVAQFYNDLIDYGIYPELLGKVDKDHKEFDKSIVISTWQSLQRQKKNMPMYDCVIVDECVSGDTYIDTPSGRKKMKDINIGDIIYSYNIKSKKVELDIVNNIFENMMISSSEKMFELEFEDGTYIQITGNHKILTSNRGYIRTDELSAGDDIINI